ncbi:hypothetical protein HKT18_13630 [Flavobacterium sp. IMCC34852]|uniref:Uncharacterized protein n=1 Tax=Flavobacterium rivulicola TaxID=2732161 RepID=A0A7Y3VZW9_9FLAO|nr:hypothetical protein [Flavobacterium sp. IMCC34852]NNT73260.1 hypothetical protein [Flavobacterium sp. IMCC34852]
MTYTIIGLIVISCIAFFFTSCRNKSTERNEVAITQDTLKTKIHKTQENTFEDLRSMAFKVTPEQLGLSLSKDKTIVYGVVMDWEMGGATASTVAYQTGDASLYLSSGGGVIGGGQHENVNVAAKHFVNFAQTFLDKSIKSETTALPEKNQVIFYLLTNKGIYAGKEEMKNFENNSFAWVKLFEEGNKVLTELRKVSGE